MRHLSIAYDMEFRENLDIKCLARTVPNRNKNGDDLVTTGSFTQMSHGVLCFWTEQEPDDDDVGISSLSNENRTKGTKSGFGECGKIEHYLCKR